MRGLFENLLRSTRDVGTGSENLGGDGN
jgi:hypothetical protein